MTHCPGNSREAGRRLLAAALLLLAALLLPAAPWLPAAGSAPRAAEHGADAQILEKKNQIKQLEFEKQQVERRLKDFHITEAETTDEIRELSSQMREVKWRERHLASRRGVQLRRSRRQKARIVRLTRLIGQNRARVGRHLRRLYRLSKAGDSAALLALARHRDFFKNAHYLSLMIETDREEIKRFQKLNLDLAAEQKKVRLTITRLAALDEQLKQERAELRKGQAVLRNSLVEMRKNRKLYKKYLEELDALREGMETAILRLERNARRKDSQPQVADPESMRGVLPPPTPGSIIAAFGQQDPRYKLKKFQRGVVIRVDEAAPVSAVAPGRVVHAGPFRGYQKLVVLDHGKGLFTVYGHLEDLQVKRGGAVPAGKRLGAATYQPMGGGYDIYFEVRWKGKPEDPLKWLKPGSYALASGNGRDS